jgi:glycosyltransferase involved in cell wall biosynthesis
VIAIDGRFAIGQRRGIGKGSLEVLRALAKGDAPLRFEILIDRSPEPALIPQTGNWHWRRLRPGAYPAWEQVALPLYAGRRHPAVIHSTGSTAPVRLPMSRSTLVVTVHDLIFTETWALTSLRQRLGRIYRRTVVPAALRRAGWVITDANAVEAQLLARYPWIAGRVSVIPIPVSQQFFDHEVHEQRRPPGYLVAFATIDPRKNLARILEAFSQARVIVPDAELLLIGSQRASAVLPVGVRALSYIPEDELVSRLARSTGLVYASLSEGFGVPILEAMALGVPVITSDRDPMRELAGGAALLVDPTSVPSIRDAMIALLSGGDRPRALSEAGRRRAASFRPERIAEQTAQLYLRLAGAA